MRQIYPAFLNKRVALALAGLLIAFLGTTSYLEKDEQRELEALFAGPYELADPKEPPYLSSPTYSLHAYATYDSISFFAAQAEDPFGQESASIQPDWIDGAGRGLLEASMQKAQRAGTVERTSAARYLYLPSVYRETPPPSLLQISYPPNNAVFPANLCAPRVDWEDPVNDLWQVTVGLSDTALQWTAIVDERSWWFPASVWDTLSREAVKKQAWIQIKGTRRSLEEGSSPPGIQASQKIYFRISAWEADNVIVYRTVVPPFNMRKTPSTYTRDIRSFEVTPFLLARDNYCYNCHTFSSKAGTSGKLGIQVRYMSPGSELPVYLGVYDIDEQRGWKAKLPFDIQMSTFMSWSPGGQFLALSATQLFVTLAPIVYETQFAGQPTSDLAIYDVDRNTSYTLPGAADPERLEILPRWSQDGQRLVYCSAPVGHHPADLRYDLYEIPFNEGKGGVPRPVAGASDNGNSNYYPRFSPDGRWMSFCQADAGILMKSSSDIYLLPASLQGAPHRLESNVEFAADSWHSWSSNSHWLVFASKRDDGIYARLYMTQIDEDGHASPAVRLPIREDPLFSFNIPEFVAQRPRIAERDLFEAVRVENQIHLVNEITPQYP